MLENLNLVILSAPFANFDLPSCKAFSMKQDLLLWGEKSSI